MNILLFIGFNIIYFSIPVSPAGLPEHVGCAYLGYVPETEYKFSMDKVPSRCAVIQYGTYYFDVETYKEDERAINELVAAGKTVFVRLSVSTNNSWNYIINNASYLIENNSTTFQNLKKYIERFRIAGVLFDNIEIYEERTAYDIVINEFVKKLKAYIPNIKVGLVIAGNQCNKFCGQKEKFDFQITNAAIDMYIIDSESFGHNCSDSALRDGRYPIETENPDIVSLTNIVDRVFASNMDKQKIVMTLNISVTKTNLFANPSNRQYEFMTYGQYCSKAHMSRKNFMCSDNPELFYKMAHLIGKKSLPMALTYLELDDFEEKCGCNINPVANAYIDAYLNDEKKECASLSSDKRIVVE